MKLLLGSIAILSCAAAAAAQSNRSVNTPLGDKDCRKIKSAEAGDDGYEGRCRGTAGYSLLLSEGDLRQNITVITPPGKQHSLSGVLSVAASQAWDRKPSGASRRKTKSWYRWL